MRWSDLLFLPIEVLWNRKSRDRLVEEAGQVARTRIDSLLLMADSELMSFDRPVEEKLLVGATKAKSVTWREPAADGSHLILIQVWGDGFIWGSWLFATDGFRVAGGTRIRLDEAELREVNP